MKNCREEEKWRATRMGLEGWAEKRREEEDHWRGLGR
jgi:hypothetical protein